MGSECFECGMSCAGIMQCPRPSGKGEEAMRSILVNIEDADWFRFKSLVSLRGKAIGPLVRDWILAYCRQGAAGERPVESPSGRVSSNKKSRFRGGG